MILIKLLKIISSVFFCHQGSRGTSETQFVQNILNGYKHLELGAVSSVISHHIIQIFKSITIWIIDYEFRLYNCWGLARLSKESVLSLCFKKCKSIFHGILVWPQNETSQESNDDLLKLTEKTCHCGLQRHLKYSRFSKITKSNHHKPLIRTVNIYWATSLRMLNPYEEQLKDNACF